MLDALYQQEIIELSRKSRARGRLDAPDASARVDNPLCGDRATIDLALDKGRITAIGHLVRGCALCEAAAEIIAESALGLGVEEMATIERMTRAFMENHDAEHPWTGLSVFAPVRPVKSRHACVLLPFTGVNQAFLQASKRAQLRADPE